MISAVLIVKNEAEMLERALSSVSEADEIVVCDTGSTDNTVDIAESFGAKVVHFDWCDDFSAARNFAKSVAKHEWILSIDADEFLEPNGIKKLNRFIKNTNKDAAFLLMKPETGYGQHSLVRLFKKSLDWSGKVHETISPKAGEYLEAQITYGYSPAHDLDPDIDMRILESIENPGPRELYYLAREYYYRNRWDEAILTVNLYLETSSWKPERADAWLMAARCLWQLSEGDDAREYCLQAINLNAHFKEALVFMGEISWPDNRMMWWKMSEFADNREVLFIRN